MARDEASAELIGGRFRLLRRLARGGSGEVFVAWDESTGQQLALKRLLPEAIGKAGVANLMREFHALSTLRHPRIIEVYQYGVDGAAPYYTMELLDGNDLSELSPLPYREACSYLRDVALSLALLHDRRLLHRDLSPRNVRRTGDGRCKLIDFGAMIPFGTPPNITGTVPCLAPEALQLGTLDQRCDLYSLGAVAYFALTGKYAYPARELSALPALWRAGARSPKECGIDVPQALDKLVMSLLSPDPVQRPSSAAEVIERLSAITELTHDDELAIGRSCLASSTLQGRIREREQILDALRKTKAGKGRALCITGDVGSGKTRLLNEASLMAQTSGLAVMHVTLREQRGVSSSLARDLVTGLMQVSPEQAERASAPRPLLHSLVQGAAREADRAELSRQVDAFVRDIASRQPLLLTFDDAHNGTDSDLALVASLAYHATDCSLCVIASERSTEGPARLASVADLMLQIPVRPLDRAQTAMLTSGLFGDVPNVSYVSDFFYRIAHGNPQLTLALAQHLLSAGTLSYVGGSWVLPEHIDESMPSDMAKTLMLRLSAIGDDARGLVELLSVRRRGASTEQLLELATPLASDQVLRALEELVRVGVLESAGYEYAFVQEDLRVELSRSLARERSQELHRRWADYLLAHAPNEDGRLEAGWHLVNTTDELSGAKLLVQVAPDLVDRRVNLASAVPALERALEVYERHDQSLSVRLRIRASLVLSSYLHDHRLANRYADETLDMLYPYTGLPDVERWARWVGRGPAYYFAVIWGSVCWLFRRPSKRGPFVVAAMKYYTQAAMGLLGLRALLLEDTRSAVERVRAFEGAPFHGLAIAYEMAHAIQLFGLGRAAECGGRVDRALEWLEGERPWQLSAQEQLDLKVGLLLLKGLNETWRAHSTSLACASQLENMGSPLAIAASLRIRVGYYLLRGDFANAQHYRKLLELQSLENGVLWQVQWFAVPIEGMAAATWHHPLGVRRALSRLAKLGAESPGLSDMARGIRLAYHFYRGDHQLAAAIGEEYMRDHPPLTRVGWAATYGLIASAYAHLGLAQRAREICENALALLGPKDLEYFVDSAPLESAYATALALTGEPARSNEVFRSLVERLLAAGEYTRAIVTQQFRVRLGRLTGDHDMVDRALADAREIAAASGNPAAVELAQRLSEERRARSQAPTYTDDDWLSEIETSDPY